MTDLIDRSKLVENITTDWLTDQVVQDDVMNRILDMPTVDAIPVEWINAWYDKYQYAEVGDLLNDWLERKEHDGRND